MAVTELKNPSSLRLTLSLGKVDGKDKRRSKTYSHLKPSANGDDVYEVATALMSLQDHALIEVRKVDNTTLAE